VKIRTVDRNGKPSIRTLDTLVRKE
jgi:hypothetical protein